MFVYFELIIKPHCRAYESLHFQPFSVLSSFIITFVVVLSRKNLVGWTGCGHIVLVSTVQCTVHICIVQC
jgi:hypothetical protein